jgi:hypothetical protein
MTPNSGEYLVMSLTLVMERTSPIRLLLFKKYKTSTIVCHASLNHYEYSTREVGSEPQFSTLRYTLKFGYISSLEILKGITNG